MSMSGRRRRRVMLGLRSNAEKLATSTFKTISCHLRCHASPAGLFRYIWGHDVKRFVSVMRYHLEQ